MPIDAPVVTAPTKSKTENRVYVEVPAEDIFEQVHPDIIVNGIHYGPGKHYVAPDLAGTINERVRLYARSQARLNSSRPDKVTKVVRGIAGGTVWV